MWEDKYKGETDGTQGLVSKICDVDSSGVISDKESRVASNG